MEEMTINPYMEKIFTEWFKNIILLLLVVIGGFLAILGGLKGWIDKTLGIDIMFLILGVILGKWFEDEKK